MKSIIISIIGALAFGATSAILHDLKTMENTANFFAMSAIFLIAVAYFSWISRHV